jgi:hypothetical protein
MELAGLHDELQRFAQQQAERGHQWLRAAAAARVGDQAGSATGGGPPVEAQIPSRYTRDWEPTCGSKEWPDGNSKFDRSTRLR